MSDNAKVSVVPTRADRADDFKGDTAHLVRCIDALLDLDDAKALVPDGLGGSGSHAYRLLCAARHRLAHQTPPATQTSATVGTFSHPVVEYGATASGTAIMTCGPHTGHVFAPIAFCKDSSIAELLAKALATLHTPPPATVLDAGAIQINDQGEVMICVNCGSTLSLDGLAALGEATRHTFKSCCEVPEMEPVREAFEHYPALRAAVLGVSDDYMTSEAHHPGHVLIPVERFEKLRAAEERIA